MIDPLIQQRLQRGVVIPAHPLALDESRRLDPRRQRALSRYYLAAGAGGLAVGVHTTQFRIRDPEIGLYEPVLALAAEEMNRAEAAGGTPVVRVGGICGPTAQAVREAELLRHHAYHAGLLNLAALPAADDKTLIAHCHEVGQIIPLFGFYLNPDVGGRPLDYGFWRRFFELPQVVAVKIAAFNRYRTLDVVRAVVAAQREDVALYTGNDDHILMDLVIPFRFWVDGRPVTRRIVGGLLGQWAVWTRQAVTLLEESHRIVDSGGSVPAEWLQRDVELTDANAALFDAAHGFAGCLAGVHEVLRRQGLLPGNWCLDPAERLSPGQAAEIERVCRQYPHLTDDAFVAQHRDEWLRG